MELRSDSFEHDAPIPPRCAFGVHDPESHVALSDNRNPHLAWSGAPEGVKSYVVICVDPDVPSKGDDVNQEGKTVPRDLPRVDFYHWALVDLPATTTEIAEGAHCDSITPKGKSGPDAGDGARHGTNGYTQWFAADPEMAGEYFGYDGPCPPWNDELVHHYHFEVYALDVDKAPVEGTFDGAAVVEAIAPHVIAKAAIVGTYHIYPDAS